MRRYTILSVLACASAAGFTHAVTFNVDFGDPAQQTAALGWNNIVSNASGGSSIDRLVQADGPLSNVSMFLTASTYRRMGASIQIAASTATSLLASPSSSFVMGCPASSWRRSSDDSAPALLK